MSNNYLLVPGSWKQFDYLKSLNLNFSKILVVGSSLENVSIELKKIYSSEVETIVDNFDSLISANLILRKENLQAKLMDFSATDYQKEEFDLIFAQASISNNDRKKILKEFKRILKPDGILCIGEIVTIEEKIPTMLLDFLETSNLSTLTKLQVEKIYKELKLEIIDSKSVVNAFSDYFAATKLQFDSTKKSLNDDEKKYYKKIITRIKHESNIFTKFRGERFLDFEMYILKVKNV